MLAKIKVVQTEIGDKHDALVYKECDDMVRITLEEWNTSVPKGLCEAMKDV